MHAYGLVYWNEVSPQISDLSNFIFTHLQNTSLEFISFCVSASSPIMQRYIHSSRHSWCIKFFIGTFSFTAKLSPKQHSQWTRNHRQQHAPPSFAGPRRWTKPTLSRNVITKFPFQHISIISYSIIFIRHVIRDVLSFFIGTCLFRRISNS